MLMGLSIAQQMEPRIDCVNIQMSHLLAVIAAVFTHKVVVTARLRLDKWRTDFISYSTCGKPLRHS
jgi:hypothetical protein